MKSINFPCFYPSHHPLAGERTLFASAILQSLNVTTKTRVGNDNPDGWDLAMDIMNIAPHPKHHQILMRSKMDVGDKFQPQVVFPEDRYIPFHQDVEIVSVWSIERTDFSDGFTVNRKQLSGEDLEKFAHNEGFKNSIDLECYYKDKPSFTGLVVCWNPDIKY